MFKTEAILASKLWILEFTTVDLINIIATIVLSKSSENIFNENRRHIQWDIDTVIKCENRSISATSSIFCMRNIETTIETPLLFRPGFLYEIRMCQKNWWALILWKMFENRTTNWNQCQPYILESYDYKKIVKKTRAFVTELEFRALSMLVSDIV